MKTVIKPLASEHIPEIVHAFALIGWHKPASLFDEYLREQKREQRLVWVAFDAEHFVGYITLSFLSDYSPFREKNISEIKDLNVLPHYRNKGFGTKLLDIAEESAFQTHEYVGIGVGLYADYGAAQRLYIKRGYIPDGKGITYDYKPVVPGTAYPVDDDLILWLTKKRPS